MQLSAETKVGNLTWLWYYNSLNGLHDLALDFIIIIITIYLFLARGFIKCTWYECLW